MQSNRYQIYCKGEGLYVCLLVLHVGTTETIWLENKPLGSIITWIPKKTLGKYPL